MKVETGNRSQEHMRPSATSLAKLSDGGARSPSRLFDVEQQQNHVVSAFWACLTRSEIGFHLSIQLGGEANERVL